MNLEGSSKEREGESKRRCFKDLQQPKIEKWTEPVQRTGWPLSGSESLQSNVGDFGPVS